jgi:hypothetical protein
MRSHPMLRMLAAVAALLIITAVAAPPAALAAGRIPEKLIYSLSWTGIPVGTATQEITEDGRSRRIVSTARSNDWLSTFFPVDDRTECILNKSGLYPGEPNVFKMLFREGSRTRDREITFNRAAGTALFHNRIGGEKVTVLIGADTMDIYSSFYYVRHQHLEPGKSIYINVLDSKKHHRIEVRALLRERIKVPAGVFDTIKIEPMVKPVGVFEGKRGAYIWLTDDERRIPVKAQTRVTVGSVTAVLTGGNY